MTSCRSFLHAFMVVSNFKKEKRKKQALCSADTSRRVGTKERIRATDGQLEQIRAQGAALRLLLHDVLVPDWLLAKCSGEDLSTGDRPADHDESLYSLARFGRNISSHALRYGFLACFVFSFSAWAIGRLIGMLGVALQGDAR